MIKKCSIRWCRYFSRFGFNFANLPLLGSCTVIALKHLMVVSGRVKYVAHKASCSENIMHYQYYLNTLEKENRGAHAENLALSQL